MHLKMISNQPKNNPDEDNDNLPMFSNFKFSSFLSGVPARVGKDI
jgi:hypothetical protein